MRRYLILNGISTAFIYGAVGEFVPSMASVTDFVSATGESDVAGNTLLTPLLDRVVTVAAELAAWL